MNEFTQAYRMQAVGENDAEINMYGEIVDSRPVDFWTGKPVEGNFIELDKFLNDLDGLSTKQNITVHINSVGGDLYGGIAIYNRLKGLPANITTVNDGLAASAGSIVFQAGNTRKVNSGSNIMLHQAMGMLFGWYQTNDLKQVIKRLDAGNKAAINIYAEASGREAEAMKALVDKETWLTGQEAVDAGLADEVIGSETAVSMSLTADRAALIVNGVSMSTKGLSNIPKGIPVLPENKIVSTVAMPTADKSNKEGSKKGMEIKNTNELRAAFPDFVAQIESEAREAGRSAGVAEERARIQGIEAIQNAIGDRSMIDAAKYGENPLSAEQLAFKAMQAQAAIGTQMLNNMEKDNKESHVEDVTSAPNDGPEAGANPELDEKKAVDEAVNLYNMMKNGGKKNGK